MPPTYVGDLGRQGFSVPVPVADLVAGDNTVEFGTNSNPGIAVPAELDADRQHQSGDRGPVSASASGARRRSSRSSPVASGGDNACTKSLPASSRRRHRRKKSWRPRSCPRPRGREQPLRGRPGGRGARAEALFDAAFSGALLDLDADGGPDSLGLRGDTGKVSCAGCHEAENGFLDTRSVFKQIFAWHRLDAPPRRRPCSTSARPRSSCGAAGTRRSTRRSSARSRARSR